ncbi:MAG TPA: sigma-70 family RNA polymerase sigma factor [Ktedonobacterales bacterium]|nr:sigma-70 family RNA polymerase sigma factor [Ktedonobacterales bacterium]
MTAPDATPAGSEAQQSAPATIVLWPGARTFDQVLAQARTRDAEALSLLYRRFLPVVYRFLLARVRDVAVAEDLTSETFFAVMDSIADTRASDEMGFATWVLGIARHKLSHHFRAMKSRREVPMPLTETAEPANAAEEDDPLLVVIARESWAEVVAALDRLTLEQRTVLLQRCILGQSAEDVARLMGKPANAIYGLQFRALAALARHLKHTGPPGGAWSGRATHAAGRRPSDSSDSSDSSEGREGHGAGRGA